ncbi:tetratricopeptide repeat (TPR)-like superfamily protein isoform X1 [Tasmannia lanceolata]|uniref:tetratricopeptide repeat (TPR)-like superfamily protein isoform X1 n=1 Tax=Tasmannia lanceolata TaxID=3420 RepID=UPI004064B8F0
MSHKRDQALEFQDLLNDLQDWEHSLKEDKKLKSQAPEERKVVTSSQKIGIVGGDKGLAKKSPIVEVHKPSNAVHSEVPFKSNKGQPYNYSRNSDAISRISSSLLTEESSPDAASEKDQGNEYFKQKKFTKAIECYSRSIALSPSSVAYANRAMAYLKIKRFEDAENGCTEALNLDDRYIKAYSRRATARKELGKLKASIEDSEFALRLEPNNQELQKQYSETKALYGKEIIKKASGAVKNSFQGIQSVKDPKTEAKGDVHVAHMVPSSSGRPGVTAVQADHIEALEKNEKRPGMPANNVNETGSGRTSSGRQQVDGSLEYETLNSSSDSSKKIYGVEKEHEPVASVQELASRAASRTMAAAAKDIVLPKSAYQFEVLWRGLSDDRVLQAQLLKTIPPSTLPQLFKNALSAPILVDIIKCISTLFMEETKLAISILDNLTKVARFDLIIMCLSAVDRADLHRIWDEVFCNEAAPAEHAETISKLRPKYYPGGWQMHVLESNGWTKEMS